MPEKKQENKKKLGVKWEAEYDPGHVRNCVVCGQGYYAEWEPHEIPNPEFKDSVCQRCTWKRLHKINMELLTAQGY